MTKRQIYIMWIFSAVLSGVLFYAGIAAPHRARAELIQLDDRPKASYWDRTLIAERRAVLNAAAEPDYYLGCALPVVLLGGCAVVAAGVRPKGQTSGRDSNLSTRWS